MQNDERQKMRLADLYDMRRHDSNWQKLLGWHRPVLFIHHSAFIILHSASAQHLTRGSAYVFVFA